MCNFCIISIFLVVFHQRYVTVLKFFVLDAHGSGTLNAWGHNMFNDRIVIPWRLHLTKPATISPPFGYTDMYNGYFKIIKKNKDTAK